MFVTGPDVIKAVTHEEVTKEELGGAFTHNSKSGVAHFMGENEESTLMMIRELFQFLPSNNMEDSPFKPTNDDLRREDEKLQTLIPDDPNKPYDMKLLINSVVDNGYFYEVMPVLCTKHCYRFCFPWWKIHWHCCQSAGHACRCA